MTHEESRTSAEALADAVTSDSGRIISCENTWATVFGYPADRDDDGQCGGYINLHTRRDARICALPVPISRATKASPLPNLKKGTVVIVVNRATGASCNCLLGDVGPALNNPQHATIDLSEAAWRALGGTFDSHAQPVQGRIPVSWHVFRHSTSVIPENLAAWMGE